MLPLIPADRAPRGWVRLGEFDALADDDDLERVQCLRYDARAQSRAVQNSRLVSPSILAVGILISYGITSARLMVV